MTNTATDTLLAAVAAGVDLVELGQPLFTGMPCSPNHPGFRMTLARRHGDMVRPDGSSAANEVIVTGGHVGT
ncbi:MAG: cyclase family protein, partial [Mycobacterium sp.]